MSSKTRIVAIDILRGFALLGIVGANIVLYDIDSVEQIEAAFTDLPMGTWGAPFMVFSLVLVVNKMMAVFSMLFGASVLLGLGEVTGRSFVIFFRRNFLLLGIGLLHSALWVGDILAVYAVCAMLLFLCRNLPALVLAGLALVLWYWAPVAWLLSGAGPGGDEFFSRALAMMLFGMSLYRRGIITGDRPRQWYRVRFMVFFLLGLPFVSLAWITDENAAAINNIGAPAVAFSYVCLVMWWCKTEWFSGLKTRLAAAGRMALSNYLLQTILGVCFYHLLQAGSFTATATLLGSGMLLIWAMILYGSSVWLRHFRHGPVEYLWRRAANGSALSVR